MVTRDLGLGCGLQVAAMSRIKDFAMPCPTGKSAMSFDLAAKARSRSSKSHDKAMGMYRCALCGDWHLGNPSRAKQPIKTIYTNHELRNL